MSDVCASPSSGNIRKPRVPQHLSLHVTDVILAFGDFGSRSPVYVQCRTLYLVASLLSELCAVHALRGPRSAEISAISSATPATPERCPCSHSTGPQRCLRSYFEHLSSLLIKSDTARRVRRERWLVFNHRESDQRKRWNE